MADGVHVGQDDQNVAEVRRVLGDNAIVGVSAGTCDEAERAILDGADYIGVGSVFGTRTKKDAGTPIGPQGLVRIVECVHHRLPVIAIGGVNEQNASQCWRAGADGVAVISAIMQSEQPGVVAEQLRQGFEEFLAERRA